MKRKVAPSPQELLKKAAALPRGVILSDYLAVMWTLKNEKGMSLRQIAAWLSDELGVPVSHTQVFRVMEKSLPPLDTLPDSEIEATESKRAELREEANK